MAIFSVVIFCVCLWSLSRASKNQYFQDYLSMNRTTNLKGILAVLIFCHHCSIIINNGFITSIFIKMGGLITAVFFFISGYGMEVQFSRKKDKYLEGYFVKIFSKLLVPYLIVILIYVFVDNLLGQGIGFKDVIHSYFIGYPIADNTWYVVAIILFYMFFYISVKFSEMGKYHEILIALSLGIYITVCLILDFNSFWYNTCGAYLVGIWWGGQKDRIDWILEKYLWRIGMGCLLVFFVTKGAGFKMQNSMIGSGLDLLASAFFAIIVVLIGRKIRFGNKVLTFLGTISFEIYMLHGAMLKIFHGNIINGNIIQRNFFLWNIVQSKIFESSIFQNNMFRNNSLLNLKEILFVFLSFLFAILGAYIFHVTYHGLIGAGQKKKFSVDDLKKKIRFIKSKAHL